MQYQPDQPNHDELQNTFDVIVYISPRQKLRYHLSKQTESYKKTMVTSSNNHSPRYWPLWGEYIGHRWIPLTKASDADHW